MVVETVYRRDIQVTAESVRSRTVEFKFFAGQGVRFTDGETDIDFRSLLNSHVSVKQTRGETEASYDFFHLPPDRVRTIVTPGGKVINVVAEELGLNRAIHIEFPEDITYSYLAPEDEMMDKWLSEQR